MSNSSETRSCSRFWLLGDSGGRGEESAVLLPGAAWVEGVRGSGGAAMGYLLGGVRCFGK